MRTGGANTPLSPFKGSGERYNLSAPLVRHRDESAPYETEWDKT